MTGLTDAKAAANVASRIHCCSDSTCHTSIRIDPLTVNELHKTRLLLCVGGSYNPKHQAKKSFFALSGEGSLAAGGRCTC